MAAEITAEMVVALDAFHDEVAHVAGQLYAAMSIARESGHTERVAVLGAALTQVWQDNTDVTFEEIDSHRARLQMIRVHLLD